MIRGFLSFESWCGGGGGGGWDWRRNWGLCGLFGGLEEYGEFVRRFSLGVDIGEAE